LLKGVEIFVAILTLFYLAGDEALGNPNSLGAVMGVLAPILLWGSLLEDDSSFARRRRLALFAITLFMAFHSHSRAGMVAAAVSCALLCLALRRYKSLGQGIVVLLIVVAGYAVIAPQAFSKTVSELTADVVYKGKDAELGLLQSRQSPWQGAIDSIRSHVWFGSGFGTTDTGLDASADLTAFESSEKATRENGSSYLTIITWVGVLGVVPFALLLFSLLWKVVRTLLWMINTGNPYHPAVPLAIAVLAGMIHAVFEDWLFAPGYYLCVFFWSLAFVLTDVAPSAPLPSFSRGWRPTLPRQQVGSVAPSR
jgi:O-antigen ligase